MTLEQMVELLNEDLRNEYKHHRFYLHASFVLRGLERLYFGDWLRKQAAEELDHVTQFANKITSFGTMPTTEANDFPNNLTRASDILNYAIQMEQEVVANYHQRLLAAEELSASTGKYYDLVLLYEEQIEHSQSDIDEMLKMVA